MKVLEYFNPKSKSGRQMSSPPKNVTQFTARTQKEWDTWLLKEAMIEATDYEKTLLKGIERQLSVARKSSKRSSTSNLSSADYDTINLILFGDLEVKITYKQ